MSPSTTVPTGGSYSKPADTCLDLNLVNADNGLGSNVTECYIGYYYSGGRWIAGAAGPKRKLNAPKFGSPVVLVSNIKSGTLIGVSSVSHSASGDSRVLTRSTTVSAMVLRCPGHPG